MVNQKRAAETSGLQELGTAAVYEQAKISVKLMKVVDILHCVAAYQGVKSRMKIVFGVVTIV